MNRKTLSFFIFFFIMILGISCQTTNFRKKELIELNPSFFHEKDTLTYLGKAMLSSGENIEIYFNEYSFGNNRKTYRIIIFENNDSIFCYKVEDKPYLKENTLFFPYEETIGSKIVLRDALPKKVYLNGELILLVKIK